MPRPASATSWDGTIGAGAFRPVLCMSPKLRSVSVSEGKLLLPESSGSFFCSVDSSASSTASEGSQHERVLRSHGGGGKTVGQQRCRSQPCVSERKGGKKRRREEEARPKLDLFKMEEVRLVYMFVMYGISENIPSIVN